MLGIQPFLNYLLMQQKQVLELIQTVVKPLRQKIDYLQKQNEKLKTQLSVSLSNRQQYVRRRSISKQDKMTPKKNQFLSPSSKEKEKRIQRPIWNHPKTNKTDPIPLKSPPPKDKNIPTPKVVRVNSKDKLQDNKKGHDKEEKKTVEAEKRIVGGKKVEAMDLVKKQEAAVIDVGKKVGKEGQEQ